MGRKKTGESSDDQGARPRRPAVIVGVGASAGGLEAIEAFFKPMPTDTGMAFVVVQHLSPDYKSLMVELLSRKTDIPVHRAEDGMVVEADHIYLIPPKKNMTVFQGRLVLEDQEPREGINLPVDIFLRSLAEDQGERAAAVILSGTGSDGARGVRAVKEWGGLVIVQSEESAKFDGMPRAAASTGAADSIIPPEEMATQLLACLRHPYSMRRKDRQKPLTDETGLTRLFSLLRKKTKVDFTFYKPSTISRRIERRIAVTQVSDLDDYVRYLEQTPAEIAALYRELLIGVTSFFRDPQVMKLLQETVLPEIFQKQTGRDLRFWTAGCSTGEEAYTLAILAREVMEATGPIRDLKIFATDIDRDAVARAGAGIYPESIAADLGPGLLAKYFYSRGETYQIARNIREMVVFAQHNLVKDPPFTRIDLVSCRNLLIYLQANLQHRALEMFRFSLRPGGVLMLGTSETVGEYEKFFEPIDRKAKIFRVLGSAQVRRGAGGAEPYFKDGLRPAPAGSGYVRPPRTAALEQDRLMARLLETIASSYAPLTTVVNENMDLLYVVGDSSGVFSIPSGKAVFDISRMVNRELSVPLVTGIQKVFRTGEEVVYKKARMNEADYSRTMTLRISPLPGRKNEETLAAVFFEMTEGRARPSDQAGEEYNLDEETGRQLQDLEQELQFTRENLQATIEELETSNEELQAANEELLAANEELQSTNEELQSTNEELFTVNAEYQNKIIELTEARNDVENLLTSSRIGTLILDEDLCIRRYSPQAAEVFYVLESDLGRPLDHISHKLLDFDPVAAARQVQKTGRSFEKDVREGGGRFFILRTLPYYIGPQSFAGVVITLIDITPLRDVGDSLKESRQTEADIVRYMPGGLFVYQVTDDNDLLLESGNPAAERITGVRVETSVGRTFAELWPGERGLSLKEEFLKSFHDDDPHVLSSVDYADERFRGVFHVSSFRLPGNRLAVGFEDITKRVAAERRLEEAEDRYGRLYNLLADAEKTARMGSWTWDPASDQVIWSENLFHLFGRDPDSGAPSFAEHPRLYSPESFARLREAVEKAMKDGTPYEMELEGIRTDGGIMPCIARGQAEMDDAGTVRRLYGSLQEMAS